MPYDEGITMTRLRIAIILVALASIGLAPRNLRAQDDSSSENEAVETAIRSVMREMRQAAEQRDAGALYAHVLESGIPPIIEDGRLAPTREAALESTAQGFRGLANLSYAYERESITAVASNTVLWVGSGTASATLDDGRQISAPFAETIVFVKHANQWKVLHAHRSAPN